MKRFSIAAAGLAALGTAACQQSGTNNSAGGAVEINGAKIGETVENGIKDGINHARDAGNAIGNELGPATEAIQNGAQSAWNGVKEGVRDLRNNEGGGGGNTAAPAN